MPSFSETQPLADGGKAPDFKAPAAAVATSVLIVDDEPTMRLLLRTALQKEGFQVTEASNGLECLEIFQQQHPDIVLMDAVMPEMDGFVCCTALQKLFPETRIPVLMITSLEDIDSINQAFESGATDYITKPIHWALLPHRMRHLQDILERQRAEQQIKASLREKEALLKEIHHRVKNNLQIISSLLNLQSSSIKDKQTLELFQISQNRVHLIALIHEKLYQSNDLGKINFRSYFQDLCDYLLRSYKLTPNSVSLMIEIDDFSLEIDTAVSCGLIINELMSNSLKYAFREFDSGVIQIKANLIDEAHFTISFRDNGVGLPQSIDTENSESLGLKIIFNLTEQLGGSLVIKRDNGTEFELTHLSL